VVALGLGLGVLQPAKAARRIASTTYFILLNDPARWKKFHILANAKRSHAGPLTLDPARSGLSALAAAIRYAAS
jgi:hypothetical protein